MLIPPENTIGQLGLAHSRRGGVPFGIKLRDRLMHLHIVGQTGTGKIYFAGQSRVAG